MFNCTLCYIENDRDEYLMLHRVKKKNDVNQDKWIGVGGKFEDGESPDECLKREVLEETGLHVRARELVFAVEGREGERFHRVDLVFLCDLLDEAPSVPVQADTNQSGIDWLDIATLNRSTLYPSVLRRQIMNLYEGKPYRVYLGNENAGDPEIID